MISTSVTVVEEGVDAVTQAIRDESQISNDELCESWCLKQSGFSRKKIKRYLFNKSDAAITSVLLTFGLIDRRELHTCCKCKVSTGMA